MFGDPTLPYIVITDLYPVHEVLRELGSLHPIQLSAFLDASRVDGAPTACYVHPQLGRKECVVVRDGTILAICCIPCV
jgi:hypothetical protein